MKANKFKQGDRVRKGRGRYTYVVEGYDQADWLEDPVVHLRDLRTGRIDCSYESRLRRAPHRHGGRSQG